MKDYNGERVEELRAELEEYGFVFNHCTNWCIYDLTAQAENAEIDLSGKTDDELREIMEEILDNNADHFIESVNDALFDGLVDMFKSEEADDDSE